MAKFTKVERQRIISEFAIRHNGQYDPSLFLQEVHDTGQDHPAHDWFEWDGDKAAREYRLWQAREFARDLTVTFSVEEVGRGGNVSVRETEAPLVLSSIHGRNHGGGYVLTNPENPEHMAEFCRQAASSLASWLRRYKGAVEHAGGSVRSVGQQIKRLDAATTIDADKAA